MVSSQLEVIWVHDLEKLHEFLFWGNQSKKSSENFPIYKCLNSTYSHNFTRNEYRQQAVVIVRLKDNIGTSYNLELSN